MNHSPVVPDFFGRPVEIDEEIVAIVAATWRLGVLTTSSCQGDDGGKWPHLMFADQNHLLRWLDFVSAALLEDEDEDESRNFARLDSDRVRGAPGDELGFSKLFYRMAPWERYTHSEPDRFRYRFRVLREEPTMRCYLAPTVEFPRADIPTLERLLREAVALYRGDE